MAKKSSRCLLNRNRLFDYYRERTEKAVALKTLTSEDVAFIESELIDVIEMLPAELQDKAGAKLDRVIMALKLVKTELGNATQTAVSFASPGQGG